MFQYVRSLSKNKVFVDSMIDCVTPAEKAGKVKDVSH